MLTALEDHDSRMTGIEAGADDFISKPFHVTELRARVKTVLRLNRYRRLRAERARFGWVVEQAQEGYLLVDQQGAMLYANSRARHIFGLQADSQVDNLLDIIERQFRPQPPEAWKSWPALPSDQVLHLLRPESARSPACWMEVKAVQQSLGEEQQYLLQLRDVTAELASQRSVWSFESLICHKLRTPITKISWGLSFIANKADRLAVAKIKELAGLSQAGVDQLKRELESVLSYLAAPSASPAEGESGFVTSRLAETLAEIAAELELEAIPVELPADVPEELPIFSRALEIILWEILQNSKKFHPNLSPKLEVRLSCRDGRILLRFRDDGVRLSPEQLHRAFLPYYQGERDFTGQVPGMGLGLTMVRSLLWEVGAECSLSNREDREGVDFVMNLPAGKASGPSSAAG
jgi:signal transduction histidine kinase